MTVLKAYFENKKIFDLFSLWEQKKHFYFFYFFHIYIQVSTKWKKMDFFIKPNLQKTFFVLIHSGICHMCETFPFYLKVFNFAAIKHKKHIICVVFFLSCLVSAEEIEQYDDGVKNLIENICHSKTVFS